MLTGEAKKDYQREYMRRKRKALKDDMRSNNNGASTNLNLNDGLLDPAVRPQVDADGNVLYDW